MTVTTYTTTYHQLLHASRTLLYSSSIAAPCPCSGCQQRQQNCLLQASSQQPDLGLCVHWCRTVPAVWHMLGWQHLYSSACNWWQHKASMMLLFTTQLLSYFSSADQDTQQATPRVLRPQRCCCGSAQPAPTLSHSPACRVHAALALSATLLTLPTPAQHCNFKVPPLGEPAPTPTPAAAALRPRDWAPRGWAPA